MFAERRRSVVAVEGCIGFREVWQRELWCGLELLCGLGRECVVNGYERGSGCEIGVEVDIWGGN